MLHIYTDGACSGNPGPGGWAIVVYDDEIHQEVDAICNGDTCTTNNRMELSAVLAALTRYHEVDITIYSDSAYVINAINSKWIDRWVKKDFKGVANPELWKAVIKCLNTRSAKVEFVKVKGHSTNELNNKADRLAVRARDIFSGINI